MAVVWVPFGFTSLLLRSLFFVGSWCSTALIFDSSRSVEICSFLVVGAASVSSSLQDHVTVVMFCFRFNPAVCGDLGLFGSKGLVIPV
ncbi:hypothetical protein L195_g054586 [Trifolium pratense]|uniref:Uncharacterized protein n=1 Tax=Trifolium pratense TaxID=57577 RepID=A0A2K3KGX3_TRIPR|nr:hypothetical protein L195_g054586 [Trifolium pratense]